MYVSVTHIDEHRVGPRGCRTYRNADRRQPIEFLSGRDGDHRRTVPLAVGLRKEAYFVWEQTADLRDAAGSNTAMHPHDWDRQAAAHWPGHPSVDFVLASRGYEEDGSILT